MSGGWGMGRRQTGQWIAVTGRGCVPVKTKDIQNTSFGEEGQGRPTEIDVYLWEIFFERESPPRKSAKRGTRNNQEKENSKHRQQPQTYLEKCNVASYY